MAVNHLGTTRMRRAAGAAACALATAGLVGAALAGAPPAGAATPSCGQSCVDLFNAAPGASLILDSKHEGDHTGNPLVLFRPSNADPAEDFTVDKQGLVSDFYAAGLVSAAVNLHYGGGAAGSPDDFAFELEFDPFGAPTNECVGTASIAAEGTGVSLQPCGVSAATIWIVDSSASINGSFVPLINGTDTNFSTPYVLTYPMSPDVQLETATLQSSAGQAPANQLWSEFIGLIDEFAATTTTVASSPDPSATGAPVTYTATISATISPLPGGGTVTFTDNGTPITGCSAVPVSGATATCTTIPGSAGAHNIVATYSGTTILPASRSAVVTQVVTSTQCASLAGCNLSGGNLAGAQLAGANLSAANLNGATLTGADLAGANLSGANFNKADLAGADLSGATVTGTTNFNHVTWSDTTCPDGTNSDNDGGTCTGHL